MISLVEAQKANGVFRYVLSGLALLYQGAKSEKVMEYWSEALNMLGKSKLVPHLRY